MWWCAKFCLDYKVEVIRDKRNKKFNIKVDVRAT